MRKSVVYILIAVLVSLSLFVAGSLNKNTVEKIMPEFSPFIPSLYGYSNGRSSSKHGNNQYRYLLGDACESMAFSDARAGSKDEHDYATNIYNLRFPKYRERVDFYNEQIDWLLDCARKTGRLRVIINYNFYDSQDQKKQRCATTRRVPSHAEGCPDASDGSPGYVLPDSTRSLQAFDLLLGKTGPKNLGLTFEGTDIPVLAGITLSEESVTWDYVRQESEKGIKYVFKKGVRAEFLDELYTKLSLKYASTGMRFFQWYSPHNKKVNYPGSSDDWPVIGADGWVFDQYPMSVLGDADRIEAGDYFRFVQAVKELGKPAYSIVWASPLRHPSSRGFGQVNYSWWEADRYENRDGGWRSFHGQVAVNQHFEIPTLFYAFTPDPSAPGTGDQYMTNKKLPYACGLGLFDYLMNTTLPYVSNNTLPLELPTRKPDWIVSAPLDCSIASPDP